MSTTCTHDWPCYLMRVPDVFAQVFSVSKSEVGRLLKSGALYCVIDELPERILSDVMWVWSGIILRIGKRRWCRMVWGDGYFDPAKWEWVDK